MFAARTWLAESQTWPGGGGRSVAASDGWHAGSSAPAATMQTQRRNTLSIRNTPDRLSVHVPISDGSMDVPRFGRVAQAETLPKTAGRRFMTGLEIDALTLPRLGRRQFEAQPHKENIRAHGPLAAPGARQQGFP
jgi:hypothetical protein